MPRFFIQSGPEDGRLRIAGEDARHMVRVLRMKVGDEVTLCNSAGVDYSCVIEEAQPEQVICRVLCEMPSSGEPTAFVTLYMALPKADKLEFVVQKAVELGVSAIVPFVSERCVSRPEEKSLRRKAERWRKIAAEAAKQCGRGRIPDVRDVVTYAQAVAEAGQAETALFFYECERETPLRGAIGGRMLTDVSLMIGPEGGFAPREAEQAQAGGLTSVSLGKRILRCDTAPLVALAAVMYESGNL